MDPSTPQGSIFHLSWIDHDGRAHRFFMPSLVPVLLWALVGILSVPGWTPIGSTSLLDFNVKLGGGIVAMATLLAPFESSTIWSRLRRTGNFVAGWLLLYVLWTGAWFTRAMTAPEREQVVGVGFVCVAAAFSSSFIIGLVRLATGGDS